MLSSQYVRNPMAKALLERMAQRQEGFDVAPWYSVNSSLLPLCIQEKFIQSCFDRQTELFLENCYEKADFIFTQVFHAFLKTFLQYFLSFTSINGLLSRGSMFVFSHDQFTRLANFPVHIRQASLLDLGAGDGKVTQVMAPHFNDVFVTETSTTMRWRLAEYGFKVLGVDEWQGQKYSVISALNIIDRVDHPWLLIRDLVNSMDPDNGLLVLAIVLPYDPCVEKGSRFNPAEETLPIVGDTPEQQICSLVKNVFEPMGLDVVRFTKVPYLCEGDIHKDFFMLDDYVFVLRRVESAANAKENLQSS